MRPDVRAAVAAALRPTVTGEVCGVVGLRFDVAGLDLPIGALVRVDSEAAPVEARDGWSGLWGEIIAADSDRLTCLPYGELRGVRIGSRVHPAPGDSTVAIGRELLGRVVDAFGRPIDDGPPIGGDDVEHVGVDGDPPHPLRRALVEQPMSLGVRAWDTLVTAGRGQRVGVFAGSGVGKSTLLGMVARNTAADVNVVALIGERGREVREFVERDLGPEGLARSVLVVATSDAPALVRLRAAFVATRIAEWFRDRGQHVMLMMDSVTRFCMAQREIGLSVGEPPTTRGYPPSVFAMLPRLLERAGAAERGSITGVYTVLVDGDDHDEPISDAVRSILDGHVVLARRLAQAGHFPAIDVLASVSRVASAVTTAEQRALATRLRSLLAAEAEARDLIDIGAYVPGSDPLVDRARMLRDPIRSFLRQDVGEACDLDGSFRMLMTLLDGTP